VTEIQSGLATAADLATVAGYIDTEVAAIKTKTDFLPSATAGTSGGLHILGSNAGNTTYSGTVQHNALVQYTAGVSIQRTNGTALELTSFTSGSGLAVTGASSFPGAAFNGGSSGNGVSFFGGAASGHGVLFVAQGTGHGAVFTRGDAGSDDLFLTNSDAPTLATQIVTGPITVTGGAVALTSAYDFAKGTVAMTESYAADGATFTPVQGFYQIWSLLAERAIASTTLTARKLDGTTPAMTFTLDSATTPTSQTRAT
jgi:hypothetical protein